MYKKILLDIYIVLSSIFCLCIYFVLFNWVLEINSINDFIVTILSIFIVPNFILSIIPLLIYYKTNKKWGKFKQTFLKLTLLQGGVMLILCLIIGGLEFLN